MGMLSRFKEIMSANINALLDKCEDPSKMIDQYMRDLTEQLADVKTETAGVMAEEKRTLRMVEENNEEIEKYSTLAKKALQAGNEDDAKVFIEKKQALEKTGAQINEMYGIARDNAQKMRDMHDKLTHDINELEIRRKNVKAKVSVAKTQDKMNKMSDSMDAASGSMRAFERMESKADEMLDRANSMAELNATPKDKTEEIEAKYAKDASKSVEDELAAMKKDLGL